MLCNLGGIKVNKKLLIMFGIAVILVVVAGAFSNVQTKNDNEKVYITTSFYPMYIATINLTEGIEQIEVNNLTQKSTGCVHDYTLTPEEMVKLSTTDLFVVNGSGMEAFLDKVVSNYPNLNVLDTSKGVSVIFEEEHGVNPHTFVSIEQYVLQIKNLQEGLNKRFPEYTSRINQNAEHYLKMLEELLQKAHSALDKFEGINVIALHESYEYFAKDFGINVVQVIEEEEGVSASASEIAKIISNIEKQDITCIVIDKDSSTNIVEMINQETSVPLVEFDTTIYGEFVNNSYISAMYKNIDNILNVLGGKEDE